MMLLPKRTPIRDRKYLDFLRTQPCIVTQESGEVEPAHLRLLGSGGTSLKPGDDLAVPLHWRLHRMQSELGEGRAWLTFANEYPDFLFRLLLRDAKRSYQMWRAE